MSAISGFALSGPAQRQAFEKNHLEMLDVVGVGRTSTVVRAVELCSCKSIAVKCIPKTSVAFQCIEIANLAKVSDHEHITSFYGSFDDADCIFLKLELAEDGTLLEAIVQRKLFENHHHLVRTALLQLIDAVHYCHEQSIFHGDLTPENILCSGGTDNLKLLVCDYGSSSNSPLSTSISYERGSEKYASPERLGEFRLSAYSMKQCDIWSIGIIYIGLVSSCAPWEKATSSAAGFNHFLRESDYLRNSFSISTDSQALVKRILSLNPTSRISLPNLRAEVATVSSFFLSDEDTPLICSPHNNYTARNSPPFLSPASSSGSGYHIPSSHSAPIPFICRPATSQSSTCSKSSLDSLTILYPSPALAFEPLTQHEPQPIAAMVARSLSLCSDSSSDDDSDLPITPFSAPVEVDVEVPELDLKEGVSLTSKLLSPPKQIMGRIRSVSWSSGKPKEIGRKGVLGINRLKVA